MRDRLRSEQPLQKKRNKVVTKRKKNKLLSRKRNSRKMSKKQSRSNQDREDERGSLRAIGLSLCAILGGTQMRLSSGISWSHLASSTTPFSARLVEI